MDYKAAGKYTYKPAMIKELLWPSEYDIRYTIHIANK